MDSIKREFSPNPTITLPKLVVGPSGNASSVYNGLAASNLQGDAYNTALNQYNQQLIDYYGGSEGSGFSFSNLVDAVSTGLTNFGDYAGLDGKFGYDGKDTSSVFFSGNDPKGSDSNGNYSGMAGSDWVNAGLGLLSYMQSKKGLKMQQQALQDQLENSRMERDLAYDSLATQKGVQASLAGALGADTSSYVKSLARFDQYASETEDDKTAQG